MLPRWGCSGGDGLAASAASASGGTTAGGGAPPAHAHGAVPELQPFAHVAHAAWLRRARFVVVLVDRGDAAKARKSGAGAVGGAVVTGVVTGGGSTEVVLGRAVVSLAAAVDARGAPARFALPLELGGVVCGVLEGSLAVRDRR